MRTHRKRKWSPLTVNMIPLINVIFLINIFIVMMINFSEVLIKRVTLPKADEAKQSTEQLIQKILVTVKSKDVVFLGRTRVTLDDLEYAIRRTVPYHQGSTVQLRGEENVTYDVVEQVMLKIAALGITRIEFSATKEPVPPLERDAMDENSDKNNE
jgi:biopolymer transport protein ExbD